MKLLCFYKRDRRKSKERVLHRMHVSILLEPLCFSINVTVASKIILFETMFELSLLNKKINVIPLLLLYSPMHQGVVH